MESGMTCLRYSARPLTDAALDQADQSGIQHVGLFLTLSQFSQVTKMSSQERHQGVQKPMVFHVTGSEFKSHYANDG